MRLALAAYAAAGLLLALTAVFPEIDLTVSGWFYVPGPEQGFVWKNWPLFRFILRDMPPILLGFAALLTVWALVGAKLKTGLPVLSQKASLFLASSLALGPGFLVNWLLKEHWGRARPSQIVEFGGTAHYTPPFVVADQCVSNCSFSSGHGALGFWVIALALLAPPRWRTAAVLAALVFGCLVGLTRIAQGGHFLSDTLFSALAVIAITLGLRRVILR